MRGGRRKLLSFCPLQRRAPTFRPHSDDLERPTRAPDIVPESPEQARMNARDALGCSTTASSSKCSRSCAKLIVGLGRLGGMSSGIVGNQPRCWRARSTSTRRSRQRVHPFCDAFGIPIILRGRPGYLPRARPGAMAGSSGTEPAPLRVRGGDGAQADGHHEKGHGARTASCPPKQMGLTDTSRGRPPRSR